MNWEEILAPYSQAVEELKVKFKGIQAQLNYESKHSPIEFITGRVKPVLSIIEKSKSKNISLKEIEDHIQDIAGLRVVCQFVDDIYAVVEMIRLRKDFTIKIGRASCRERKSIRMRSVTRSRT